MALYFSNSFISGTKEYSTLEQGVPAPYLRKSFVLEQMPEKAEIRICGLGFYELFLNGNKITKGALAPYISAADQIVHYDDYDVTQYLLQGENVIGVLLGNGNQNSFGAFIWEMDKAAWRSAPKMAMVFSAQSADGTEFVFESDQSFKTAPSPIICDDIRLGEQYDARLEKKAGICPDMMTEIGTTHFGQNRRGEKSGFVRPIPLWFLRNSGRFRLPKKRRGIAMISELIRPDFAD